ncbi:MAG: hypothetical protein MUC43_06145 [Pirellula sp.]|nr:hypothetical protein [Pirellula sp.]
MSSRQTHLGERAETHSVVSPFGSTASNSARFQFPITTMLLAIVVSMACISMLILAFRVPEVQGMVIDLFGGTKKTRSSNHETQLRFLMVCYSAPLLLTGITGIVYYVSTLLSRPSSQSTEDDDDSPFS